MAFEKIKITYLKQKLLLEEKKVAKRDTLRLKKDKLETKKQDLKLLESELIRRIKKEQTRDLTDSDRKRIKARKLLYAQRKSEIIKGLKSIARETKDFLKHIASEMDKAEKKKTNSIKTLKKKNQKRKSKKK